MLNLSLRGADSLIILVTSELFSLCQITLLKDRLSLQSVSDELR